MGCKKIYKSLLLWRMGIADYIILKSSKCKVVACCMVTAFKTFAVYRCKNDVFAKFLIFLFHLLGNGINIISNNCCGTGRKNKNDFRIIALYRFVDCFYQTFFAAEDYFLFSECGRNNMTVRCIIAAPVMLVNIQAVNCAKSRTARTAER